MIGAILSAPWFLRVAKWGLIALAVLGLLVGIRNSGRQAERVENLENALRNARRRSDVDETVRRLPDGDAARELHDRWQRD